MRLPAEKIVDLETLDNRLSFFRHKKIVQCHGCFDLVHPGHILHFLEAKKQGDILIVTLTKDEYVRKGLGRPFFNNELRALSVASLECVDYVVLINDGLLDDIIWRIKPNIYCKGNDYERPLREEKAVKSVGGKIYITQEQKYSSTELLRKALGNE